MKRVIAVLALTVMTLASMQTALSAREVILRTGLNGDREVPGPGDPNGSGRVRLVVDSEAGSICYRVTFTRIGRANAAHIHRGRKGEAGDVVVTLWATSEGSPAQGCVDVRPGLADRIQSHPRRYYVNLHTREYPDGAIRGNLTPAR